MRDTESNWLKAWNNTLMAVTHNSTDLLVLFVITLFAVGIILSAWRSMEYHLAMERLKPSIPTTVVEETILDADGKPVKIVRTTTTTPPEEKP